MKVIILAAGYAVRLQPLTLNTPKPLLPVNGRTILDRIMDKIAAVKGWDAIYIVTNEKFYGNFNAWKEGSPLKDRIAVISDGTATNENRLGAIGDMELVIARYAVDDDVLVVAGDNLFDLDLAQFVGFAASRKDGVSVALYDVGDPRLAANYGIAAIDKDNRVTDFEEKPAKPKSTLSSTGLYFFPKNKLFFIKEYVKMQNKSNPSAGPGPIPGGIDHRSRGVDAPGYYVAWLSRADRVYGFKFLEDWYDIGNIESYKKADSAYREKEQRHGKE